ncbi:MAG: cupin domain-containing protein [bacterium]
MKHRFVRVLAMLAVAILAVVIGATLAEELTGVITSKVKTQQEAAREEFDWGSFHTYYQGETYGTKDVMTGVAVIKPGLEIHPPHQHAEEEYLMVTEGQGTWHLNGKDFNAQKGDMLYAAPWDVHGIKNTGTAPLTFVVWKWNTKGLTVPTEPPEKNN